MLILYIGIDYVGIQGYYLLYSDAGWARWNIFCHWSIDRSVLDI